MDSSHKTRAAQLLDQVNEDLSEEASRSGLPEFHGYPTLLSKYSAVSTSFKKKPANVAHILALAKAYMELAAELDALKKALGKR